MADEGRQEGVYDPDEAIVEAFLEGGRNIGEILGASRRFDAEIISGFDEVTRGSLNTLGLAIVLSRGIISRFSARFRDELSARPPEKPTVLLELAKRAVLVSEECRLLLEHGRAYGAEARWRTLYELAASAKVLAAATGETVKLFVACEEYQDQSFHKKAPHLIKGFDLTEDAVREWELQVADASARTKQLLATHGELVANQYGWAHGFLLSESRAYRRESEAKRRPRGPTQLDLSIWCGFGSDHPYYALASGPVHGANPEPFVGFASERPADLTRPSSQSLKIIIGRTVKFLNVTVQNGTADLAINAGTDCSDLLALRNGLAELSEPEA